MGNQKICELCSNEAAVYCPSDSAFLCMSCDTKVHGANFLVARHLRQVICSNCQDFTGDHISGGGVIYKSSNCPFCSTSELDSGELDSLSSSSSCVLSSFFTRKKSIPVVEVNGGQRVKWGIDSKTEGVFVNLCKRFGLNDEVATVIVRMACNGLAGCEGKLSSLPFRVRLAASLWFGLRFSGIRSLSRSQGLTRLEQITGVPAKLISVAELKIERIYRPLKQGKNNLVSRNYNQHGLLLKEGWAESS